MLLTRRFSGCAGRTPAFPLALREPHHGDRESEGAQHEETEILGEVADGDAEEATEDIAGGDEARPPDRRAQEIEQHEAAATDRADAQREGRDVADAVNEAEG